VRTYDIKGGSREGRRDEGKGRRTDCPSPLAPRRPDRSLAASKTHSAPPHNDEQLGRAYDKSHAGGGRGRRCLMEKGKELKMMKKEEKEGEREGRRNVPVASQVVGST